MKSTILRCRKDEVIQLPFAVSECACDYVFVRMHRVLAMKHAQLTCHKTAKMVDTILIFQVPRPAFESVVKRKSIGDIKVRPTYITPPYLGLKLFECLVLQQQHMEGNEQDI
jgi:hypothetical protein